MISDSEILSCQANRAYPVPDKPWKYYQRWQDVLFLHWEVDASYLRTAVPAGLELDVFEGKAWISVVAFSVKDMQLRGLPPVSFLSDFHEVNIRTYVTYKGIPGIYFLAIDAQKLLPVLMARTFIGLPYRKAGISRQAGRYRCNNSKKSRGLDVVYSEKKPICKTDMDRWLTERHALYEQQDGRLFRIDIHHYPWLLQKAGVAVAKLDYPFLTEPESHYPDRVHFSPGVKVLIWGKHYV